MLGLTLGTTNGSDRRDRTPAWLPLYLLLVLGVTLSPPFVQCIPGPIGLGWKPVDLLQNAVLFVPLGIALRRAPWWTTLSIAVVVSGSIELAQRWMLRDPNAADVLANVAGALLGRVIIRPRLRPLRRVEAVTLFGLAGLVPLGLGLASAPRASVSDFSNWEPFPLALGNEPRSVNRGWPGVMSDVSIYDRAVGSREIARWTSADDARPWSQGGPILAARLAAPPDGRLDGPEGPEAIRLAPPPGGRRIDAEGFFSGGTPWVLPEHASEHVRKRLMDSGRMSVRTRVRALDLGLFAPGRIVTLSQIPGARDFTLGQRGRNLHFRVRTPGNGGNGDRVTAFTRGGPVDLATHEVWGVFDGNVARIYIDGQCWGDALVAATRVRNRLGNSMMSLMIAATAFTGLAVGALAGGSLLRRRTFHVAAGAAAWLSLFAVGLWRPFPDFEIVAVGIGVGSLLAAAPLLRGRSHSEPERPTRHERRVGRS